MTDHELAVIAGGDVDPAYFGCPGPPRGMSKKSYRSMVAAMAESMLEDRSAVESPEERRRAERRHYWLTIGLLTFMNALLGAFGAYLVTKNYFQVEGSQVRDGAVVESSDSQEPEKHESSAQPEAPEPD